YLLIYSLSRHLKDQTDYSTEDVTKLFNTLDEKEDLKDLINLIRQANYGKLKDVFKALLNTPSDTRPGLNLTSLASHMLLTGVVLWSLQPNSVDLPYLRLGALFHDIGKLTNPQHHVVEGREIVKSLMECTENSKIREVLGKVIEMIEKHHGEKGLLTISDQVAASTDRLMDILEKDNELKNCYDKGFECAGSKEEYERLTRKAVKILKESQLSKLLEGDPQSYIYYIDFPSVQKFIESFSDLKTSAMASFFIDFSVSTLPIIALDKELGGKTKIPIEALLSGYGGHSLLVVRRDILPDKVKETISKIEVLKTFDVKLNIYYAPFMVNDNVISYKELWEGYLSKQMASRFKIDFEERIYSYGLHKMCRSCGVRPVRKDHLNDEIGRDLCDVCYNMTKLGEKRAYNARAMAKYFLEGKGISVNEEERAMDAMEFIAGEGPGKEEKRYLALIYFDGNSMGTKFKSLTFSEYVDKSMFVDFSIKDAYYDTLTMMDDETIKRILVGTMYLGGDEGLILMPSGSALDFTCNFLKKITEKSKLTAKSGVLVIDPTHPIQFAIPVTKRLTEDAKIEEKNSIGVLTITSGVITPDSYEELKDIGDEKKLLRVKNPAEGGICELVKLDKATASDAYKTLEGKLLSNYEDSLDLLIRTLRQRVKDKSKSSSEVLQMILSDTSKNYFPILDYYYALKSLKVGGKLD
ncbi:MAG: HD domain-containing protein, partial [Sulfolobus sp.]|nr:HD domain-containing protein [Sulfolobus sp.]